ncbi:hypothetical protein [Novosphingobium terrae]|uniref:hypothetical protein n=1 Tax=Novosphingobium terrae TaxID=2726189 RepID=UPI00197E2DB7|nr:hypothetical protein [Novosphingobium terrae]
MVETSGRPDSGDNVRGKKKPELAGGGEDESSTSHEGNDDHLHEDQKPLNNAPKSSKAAG